MPMIHTNKPWRDINPIKPEVLEKRVDARQAREAAIKSEQNSLDQRAKLTDSRMSQKERKRLEIT